MDPIHYSAAELAERFGLEIRGDGARRVSGVGTLGGAGADELSFLSNGKYAAQLRSTRAGVVVLREENLADCPATALVAKDSYVAYARIAALFERLPAAPAGVHPSAVVAPSARVTLVTRVTLGRRVLVHPGAVIGSDGFGLAFDTDHWIKLPQLGGVRVGDDCEIGANTTIDRGALEDTVLEEDVRLDNQIQIAHNVHVGAHTAMAGCAAVAGSARIGRYCMIGGNAGVLGHLELADRVTITAKSLVTHSIREPGEYSSGVPLQDNRLWRRNAARFKHLDEYARRVAALEKDRNDD
jgi:UDP-3-O-[3-hydroxymyristoyl] glucosamine N-acyltransferase